FGANRVSFFRYHPHDRTLHLEFEFGTNPRADGQTEGRSSHEDDNTFIGLGGRERVPYRIVGISADPRWSYSQSPMRASLSVPVQHERKLLGVLSVLSETADAYTADHERLLTLFANQIGVAFENGRLFDEARQRVAELETINRVSIALRQEETFAGTL